ncbi:MAG: glycosyltransferase [Nitrospiraceae bacterium]|nr:glycosyltransferase [Nitrospiraceae bacterium]
MKIILSVPEHLKTVPMNTYVYETLVSMGHEVVVFNFGSTQFHTKILKKISKPAFISNLNRQLKKTIKTFKPDIFLTIFGFDHDKEILEYIRSKNILTICWWLNDPFQIKRSIEKASHYDYYFTNARGSLADYCNHGIQKAFYLPVGAFPLVHRKIAGTGHEYDISFVGDWGPARENILTELSRDFNISIFGPWIKKLGENSILRKKIARGGFFKPEEMVVIYSKSKIALNIHSWFGKWDYGTNPRVFEASGCGILQICDYKDEIPDLYEPDKEIVLYKTIEELKDKLRYFSLNQASRISIAENACLRTLKDHTYEKRLQEMFSICRLT